MALAAWLLLNRGAEQAQRHEACPERGTRELTDSAGTTHQLCVHELRWQRHISGGGGLLTGLISTGVGEVTAPSLIIRSGYPVPVAAATSIAVVAITNLSATSTHFTYFLVREGLMAIPCSPSPRAHEDVTAPATTGDSKVNGLAVPGDASPPSLEQGVVVTVVQAQPRRRPATSPSRRAFLRRALGATGIVVLAGFGAASLGFLWPDLRGGFGAVLEAGDTDEVLQFIRDQREPFEFAPGRTYIVEYDEADDPDGEYAEITNGAPVMALFWTCVHLGCKVPWCMSSQWLECGCHGSGYNRWGEYQEGPAPRGLDRFRVEVAADNQLLVDTSEIITGPPRGTDVLQQEREGPSCI
jgi:cytochrome b6-f complex iron-sulfur subunit